MSLIKYPLTLLKKDINDLEYNAKAQYKFNRAATCFWIINMPTVVVLDVYFRREWLQISVMYLVQVSIWSLVATHFGAMSASLAADNGKTGMLELNQDIDDISEDIDDIHDTVAPDSVEPTLQGHPEVWSLPVSGK